MLKRLKHKKAIIPIVAFFIIAGIVFYFSDWIALSFLIKTKYSKTKTPEMYLIPITREVQLSKEKFSTHYLLSYENIKLKVPWKLKEKLDFDYSTFYVFINKKGIEISQKSKEESFRQKLLDEEPLEVQKSKLLYGEENLKSEYAITSLILHTTPEQFSIFRPLPENVRVIPLLMLKGLYSVYGNVTYKFNLDNAKCFQFGNPQTTENVRVYVFNEKDKVFILHFAAATQAEIDHILSSIEFY